MLTAIVLVAAASATEIGTERTLGMGPVIGTATGGTAHVYLGGRDYALDVAYGLAHGEGVYDAAFGQLSVHRHVALAATEGVVVPWRIGLGGFVSTRDPDLDGSAFGVRLPVGLDLDLVRAPVQVSFEVSPLTLTLTPVIRYGLDASIAVRYYL